MTSRESSVDANKYFQSLNFMSNNKEKYPRMGIIIMYMKLFSSRLISLHKVSNYLTGSRYWTEMFYAVSNVVLVHDGHFGFTLAVL